MFVVVLSTKGLPEELEPYREAHYAWGRKGFEDGVVLAGGLLVPPTGGFLLARHDRAAVEALIAAEPYARHGLAEIELAEIDLVSTATGLEQLKAGQAG